MKINRIFNHLFKEVYTLINTTQNLIRSQFLQKINKLGYMMRYYHYILYINFFYNMSKHKNKNKTQLELFLEKKANKITKKQLENQIHLENNEIQHEQPPLYQYLQPQENSLSQQQDIIPQNKPQPIIYKNIVVQHFSDKQIYCRESELQYIRNFLKQPAQISPFLYICGEVGMGKTKSVQKILQEINLMEKCLWINGYAYIIRIRQQKAFHSGMIKNWIPQHIRKEKQIVVIDEFDKVSQKRQLLQQIHEKNIKAILICNEYNIQIEKQIQIPFKILLFQPYNWQQLFQIADNKFNKQKSIITKQALTYLSKKLCNQSSDIRRLEKTMKNIQLEKQSQIINLSHIMKMYENPLHNKYLKIQIEKLNTQQKQILKVIIQQNQKLMKLNQMCPKYFSKRKLRLNTIHNALGIYKIKKNALYDHLIQFYHLNFINIGGTFSRFNPLPNEQISLLLEDPRQILKFLQF